MNALKKSVTTVLLGAALAAGGLATAIPANAAGCYQQSVASKDGRVVYLWNCGSTKHGQIANGSTGDLVYMRTISGATAGGMRVAPGQTSVNSGSVSGGPWAACVAVHDRPGQDFCTGYYS